MLPDLFLALAFCLIAFIYASVGFGGGSSYLALLAVAGLPFAEIRLNALLCNIIVVSGGALVYWRHGQLNLRKILPLVAASMPAAFLGASMRLHEAIFFKILGISLLIAGLLLWAQPRDNSGEANDAPARPWLDGLLGASVGWLSGMVGIGGGIFLSPLLHFFRWDGAKKIAATASAFIWANSMAGLAGQLSHWPDTTQWQRTLLLCGAVLLGGQLGSRISQQRFSPLLIRRLTGLLVFFAGLEVFFK